MHFPHDEQVPRLGPDGLPLRQRGHRAVKQHDRQNNKGKLPARRKLPAQTVPGRRKKHHTKETSQPIDPKVASTCAPTEIRLDRLDGSAYDQNKRHDEKKLDGKAAEPQRSASTTLKPRT